MKDRVFRTSRARRLAQLARAYDVRMALQELFADGVSLGDLDYPSRAESLSRWKDFWKYEDFGISLTPPPNFYQLDVESQIDYLCDMHRELIRQRSEDIEYDEWIERLLEEVRTRSYEDVPLDAALHYDSDSNVGLPMAPPP